MIRARFRGGALLLVAAQLVPMAAPLAAEPDSLRVPLDPAPEEVGFPWAYVGATLGFALGVTTAVVLKSEADARYDLYLGTADPEAAQAYFDDAERYDRATILGWALAEASVVALFFLLTQEKERPLIPTVGEPLVRYREDGVEIGLRVRP